MKEIGMFICLACSLFAGSKQFNEGLHSNWRQSFSISKELYRDKTEHQDLVIFENKRFGKVLALDGIIQLTEADEPIYHEMIVHVPLLTHGAPTSILILGGGDGGALREVLKYPSVKRAVLVDIDSSVIELSTKYFPKVSNGAFEDPRVQIIVDDASKFVTTSDQTFDVIICDSTDPIGPGACLFTSEFYGECKKRLKPGGIFVNQGGVPFLQQDEFSSIWKNLSSQFHHAGFYVAPVPTYVGGFMAFGWASDTDYQVSEETLRERAAHLGDSLFYYTPKIHKASFALPHFMVKQMQ
ncbi:MAG TPA: polyamine aminopropyltransferase [Rhabdochlamydiaceae bacterium]|nr:polyamine aminopropyltransferase [Rhabdochlamydiaceae bacterium]HSX37986.1 polyamine aminopropyltransferase [Chlamydiales bacterium]